MICMFKEFHCHCQMMYLRTLDICVLIYHNLILQNYFQQASLKKTIVKLEFLTYIDMN